MKLIIAVPCYNEENRLPAEQFIQFISKNEIRFCFINDGSRDDTISVLNSLKSKFPTKVFVADSKKNLGKSNAISFGYEIIKNENFTHFAYLDADLATPIDELIRISNYLNDDVEFVFGSRVNRVGSNIKRKLYRHLLGRFFATINSLLLNIPVYDTQCGAKILSKELSEIAFSKKFISNWVFDLEVFFRIINFKIDCDINHYAKEIPLEIWTDVGESSIKPKHYLGIFRDLFKIYRLYKLLLRE